MKTGIREIASWCVFDVANSAYTTIIITVAFNVIFSQLIVGPAQDDPSDFSHGNLLWSIVLSVSWLLCAVSGPVFGAMSDLGGSKKRFLFWSVVLCCVGTGSLFFVKPGDVLWASLLIIVTNLAFALSENFISAFLPGISTPENIGKISGWGWGLGYLGGLGSVVLCSSLIGFEFTSENYGKLRWIGPLTAAFYLVFSIPTFLYLTEPTASKNGESLWINVLQGYQKVFKTVCEIRSYRDLTLLLFSFLFFQAGLSIAISFSGLYGQQELMLSAAHFTLFFLTLQVSAALGAILFGFAQDKFGPLRTLNLTLVIWVVTLVAISQVGTLGESTGISAAYLFIAVGNFAGLCLGATQACTRTLVGLFAPPQQAGEFFGFWGLFGKLAAVFGVLAFGALQSWVSLRHAMLWCIGFFVVGLLINQMIDEQRGKEAANHSSTLP